MTIAEFKQKSIEAGYVEYPDSIYGNEPILVDFIKYNQADHELKLYLTEMLLIRCFPATGGHFFPKDSDWLIYGFLDEYTEDPIRYWLTPTIRQAISMIVIGNIFTHNVIATTFMYGIIEFFAKHNLGYNPNDYDFFDNQAHAQYRKMFLGDAIRKLKKLNKPIAKSLNVIDKYQSALLKSRGVQERRWVKAGLADRLILHRNSMLHGEAHAFYNEGTYLVLLYILFYLHELEDGTDV